LIFLSKKPRQKKNTLLPTLRPKILAKLNKFVDLPQPITPEKSSLDLKIDLIPLDDLEKTFDKLQIDSSVKKSQYFHGGATRAKKS
jgi:hypothetical protein